MPPATSSQIDVDGSVSTSGLTRSDAAPADGEVEDDRQAVEAAGQEALLWRCPALPRPRQATIIEPARARSSS